MSPAAHLLGLGYDWNLSRASIYLEQQNESEPEIPEKGLYAMSTIEQRRATIRLTEKRFNGTDVKSSQRRQMMITP